MILKQDETLRCPRCGGQEFHATAHVTQDWVLDGNGAFTKSLNDCVEVTHYPDSEDIWDCAACGYSGIGVSFITKKSKADAGRGERHEVCLEKKIVLTTAETLARELVDDLGNGDVTDNGDRCSRYFPIAKGYSKKLDRQVTVSLIEEKNGLPSNDWYYGLHFINDVDGTDCQILSTEHFSEGELAVLLDDILKKLERGEM